MVDGSLTQCLSPMKYLHVIYPSMVASSLSLSLLVPWICCLSLTVSPVPYMSLALSHGFLLSLTVSLVPWNCYMSLNVSHGCLLSPRSHGVATYLSQFPMVDGCLSLSLSVPWICCMSLNFSQGYWLTLTVSPVYWSCYMSLTLSHSFWLSFTVNYSAMNLLHVSHCLPSLLAVPQWLSGLMELLHFSQCLPWLLAVSHCLFGLMELHHVSHCLSL